VKANFFSFTTARHSSFYLFKKAFWFEHSLPQLPETTLISRWSKDPRARKLPFCLQQQDIQAFISSKSLGFEHSLPQLQAIQSFTSQWNWAHV
jgi:hypothetical protein